MTPNQLATNNKNSASVSVLSYVLLMIIVALVPGSLDLLALEPALVRQGEWWRIISGHWVHSNYYHLLINIAAFAALWSLHGNFYTVWRLGMIIFLCSLVISSSVIIQDDLSRYVGFSAVLHGLFSWGCWMSIRNRDYLGWVLLAGLALKLIYEQTAGGSSYTANLIAMDVAIDAHVYGSVAGLFIGFFQAPDGSTEVLLDD